MNDTYFRPGLEKFSASEQVYTTSSFCGNSVELRKTCVAQKEDCEVLRNAEAAREYKHNSIADIQLQTCMIQSISNNSFLINQGVE